MIKSPILNDKEEYTKWVDQEIDKVSMYPSGCPKSGRVRQPDLPDHYPCVAIIDHGFDYGWWYGNVEFVYLQEFQDEVEAWFLNGDNNYHERVQYALDNDGFDAAVNLAQFYCNCEGKKWYSGLVENMVEKMKELENV